MGGWNGLCAAGNHGLDFLGQRCDLCAKEQLERFEAAVADEKFSHVTVRCIGVDSYWVYHRDASSPTKVICVGAAPVGPEAGAILRRLGKRVTAAGERGERACRAAIRGGG